MAGLEDKIDLVLDKLNAIDHRLDVLFILFNNLELRVQRLEAIHGRSN